MGSPMSRENKAALTLDPKGLGVGWGRARLLSSQHNKAEMAPSTHLEVAQAWQDTEVT